ncbi:MAG: acetyl-CoA carboxylase biotin carboxyl carrier protein [Opitutae bacterium]|nr:acetyl-CoA carboxylase biotin carboxyl carrier protein [Opitutae bacterium]
MDLKAIKQVVEMMKRSEISEFEIEEKDFKLRLCRKNGETQIIHAAAPLAAAPAAAAAAPAAPTAAAAPVEEKGISMVTSPMVGTFYTAASPESPAFAKVGSKVGADSIVCIIEAMKVMNEIQSEISGTITEILVENGAAVEYGQPLFKVKTA